MIASRAPENPPSFWPVADYVGVPCCVLLPALAGALGFPDCRSRPTPTNSSNHRSKATLSNNRKLNPRKRSPSPS